MCWNDGGTLNKSIDAFCGIESVRAVMVSNGDSAKNLWLTEFGWATASGATNGVTEAVQADYLSKAFKKLDSYPYVTNAFWYSFRNNYWSNNDQADVEANYGLVRVDFSVKPALAAFKALTTATTIPTTTTTAPTIDNVAPVITNVAFSSISNTSARVKWLTNEASTTVVEYWKTGVTPKTVTNASRVTSHNMLLTGLARQTTYNVRVRSTDAAGNTAVGATTTFKTK